MTGDATGTAPARTAGRMRMVLEIAAAPLFAVALFATGILAAVAHLVALPGLYLWEKYQEAKPLQNRRPGGPGQSRPGQTGPAGQSPSQLPGNPYGGTIRR